MPILALVPALLLSGVTAQGPNAVSLKFHPPIGKTYKYLMSMTMSMEQGKSIPAMSFGTQVEMDMKVLSRTGDVTSLQTKMGKATVNTPPGSPIAASKASMEKMFNGMVVKSKIDSLYHVRGVAETGGAAEAMMGGMSNLGNMSNMSFPNHPIRVGETWSGDMDLGKAMGGLSKSMPGAKITGDIPIKFTLMGLDRRGGQPVANIRITMIGDMSIGASGQSMKIHMDANGNCVLELATGMTVSTRMIAASTMNIGGMKMVQHMTQAMTLR
jgi:hypothetical protein